MLLELYFVLFVAMVIVATIPGPAIVAITSATITSGARRGIWMTIGLVIADYLLIFLAISGLSLVAELLGEAFFYIKYLCAAWLVWIGISILKDSDEIALEDSGRQNNRQAMLMGFLITMSNPKALAFYIALFPGFVDIAQVSFLDSLGIICCATLAFGGVNLGYVYFASKARHIMQNPTNSRWMRKCAGSVLIASGTSIAIRS